MAAIKLGWEPHRIQPIFSKGEDWIVSIEPSPGSESPVWPAGTTVVAVVYDKDTVLSVPLAQWPVLFEWPAEIIEDVLYFRAESDEVDQVPSGSLMRIRVSYPNGTERDDFLFAKGTVARDD